MAQIVHTVTDAFAFAQNKGFPILLIPVGQADPPEEMWLVIDQETLRNVFESAFRASSNGVVVVSRKGAVGEYYQQNRTPKDVHLLHVPTLPDVLYGEIDE